MAHLLSSGLSDSGVNFVSFYCEDRAFAYDLTWPVKKLGNMWHLHQTQGKQNLNCGQCSSTLPVNIQVGVLQQPTTGAGSPGTKDQCGGEAGVGERLSRALGCWESGVESTQP